MAGSVGGAVVDLGIGLFADGGDDDGEAVRAGGVEQEEGEAAVAGDEAELAEVRRQGSGESFGKLLHGVVCIIYRGSGPVWGACSWAEGSGVTSSSCGD